MPSVRAVTASYGGGNDEREQTLNQLLAEMDGFDYIQGYSDPGGNEPSGEFWIRHFCRPGRFDRRIIVDKPDLKGRVDDSEGACQRMS